MLTRTTLHTLPGDTLIPEPHRKVESPHRPNGPLRIVQLYLSIGTGHESQSTTTFALRFSSICSMEMMFEQGIYQAKAESFLL